MNFLANDWGNRGKNSWKTKYFRKNIKGPSNYLRSLHVATNFRFNITGFKCQSYQWKEAAEGRFLLDMKKNSWWLVPSNNRVSFSRVEKLLITGAVQVKDKRQFCWDNRTRAQALFMLPDKLYNISTFKIQWFNINLCTFF